MGLVEIVSGIGNAVSTVGRGASSVGRISAEVPVSTATISGLGRLSALGSRMAGPILPVVNEGPVIGGLEMFKPIAPIGQINFKQNQSELNPADAVLEAQSILAQARLQPKSIEVPNVFQAGLSDINLDPSYPVPVSKTVEAPKIAAVAKAAKVEASQASDALKLAAVRETISGFLRPFIPAPVLEPVIKPKSILTTQVATQPQTETAVSQSVPISIGTAVEEQQIEELVEEEVAAANEDTQIQSEEAEDIKELKIQRVVDEPVIRQREKEITGAVQSAADEIAAEALEGNSGGQIKISEVEIEGERISKYLPSQHKNNRSGELNIVDPDEKILDGTLIATFKDIVSVKFSSVVDAIKRVPKIVAKHRPVTRGEGELVTDEDVAKVYDHKGKIPPAQQVIKRVVRMLKQIKIVKKGEQPVQIIPIQEEVVERNEGTLQSQPDLAAALLE